MKINGTYLNSVSLRPTGISASETRIYEKQNE
jgi:hypothetical protein